MLDQLRRPRLEPPSPAPLPNASPEPTPLQAKSDASATTPATEVAPPPKIYSETLDGVHEALRDHEDVRAAQIVNHQSMPVLLLWCSGLGSGELAAIQRVALGVGGPRLQTAASLVQWGAALGTGTAEALSQVFSGLPSDQKQAIVQHSIRAGVAPYVANMLLAPPALWDARRNFWSRNSDLGATALLEIERSVWTVAGDLPELVTRFYNYYGNVVRIQDRTIGHGPELEAEDLADPYVALTSPGGDTAVDLAEMKRASPAELGAILMHEFLHTRHEGKGDARVSPAEGEAYAADAFFARRAGAAQRAEYAGDQIERGTVSFGVFSSRWEFMKSALKLAILQDYIDRGRARASVELTTLPVALASDQARDLLASFMADSPDAWPPLLKTVSSAVEVQFADAARRKRNPSFDPSYRAYGLKGFTDEQLFSKAGLGL